MIKVNKKIDSFPHLDLDVLLNSYMNGIFPMAESKIEQKNEINSHEYCIYDFNLIETSTNDEEYYL